MAVFQLASGEPTTQKLSLRHTQMLTNTSPDPRSDRTSGLLAGCYLGRPVGVSGPRAKRPDHQHHHQQHHHHHRREAVRKSADSGDVIADFAPTSGSRRRRRPASVDAGSTPPPDPYAGSTAAAAKSMEPWSAGWFIDPVYGLPVGTLADDRRLLIPQLPGHLTATKVIDPTLTFAGLLLDPKLIAIAQMQHLRLLQQSYLASGSHPPPPPPAPLPPHPNFALLPEPLLPSDVDPFWQTKHHHHHPDYHHHHHHLFPPSSSTAAAWMLPPWCPERSSPPGSTGLRYPPGEDRRLGPDRDRAGGQDAEEESGGQRGVQDPSEPALDAVEVERDRLDYLPNSVRKCKQVKTFLEREKQAGDRMKRERRRVSSLGEPRFSHRHRHSWLEPNQFSLLSSEIHSPERIPDPAGRHYDGLRTYRIHHGWPDRRTSLSADFADGSYVLRDGAAGGPLERSGDPDMRRSSADSDQVEDLSGKPRGVGGREERARQRHLAKGASHDDDVIVGSFTSGARRSLEGEPGEKTTLKQQRQHHPYQNHFDNNDNDNNNRCVVDLSRNGSARYNSNNNGSSNAVTPPHLHGSEHWTANLMALKTNGQFLLNETPSFRSSSTAQVSIAPDVYLRDRKFRRSAPDFADDVATAAARLQHSFFHPGAGFSTRHHPRTLPAELSPGSLLYGPDHRENNNNSSIVQRLTANRILLRNRISPLGGRTRRSSVPDDPASKRARPEKPRPPPPQPATTSPLPSWMNISTFTTSSANYLDNFKSIVDHTVQNAFINEMKEAESRTASNYASKIARSNGDRDHPPPLPPPLPLPLPPPSPPPPLPASTRASAPSSASSSPFDSTSPVEVSTFMDAPSSPRVPAPPLEDAPCEGDPPRYPSSPLDHDPSDGSSSQLNDFGVHTKFKKTWLLNYLDEGGREGRPQGATGAQMGPQTPDTKTEDPPSVGSAEIKLIAGIDTRRQR